VLRATQETSVVPVVAIGDKRMLTDRRVGKVQWMSDNPKKKPPKSGWSTHDARVLHMSGNIFVFSLSRPIVGLYAIVNL